MIGKKTGAAAVAVMLFFLGSCDAQAAEERTIYAKVRDIEGGALTLVTGSLKEVAEAKPGAEMSGSRETEPLAESGSPDVSAAGAGVLPPAPAGDKPDNPNFGLKSFIEDGGDLVITPELTVTVSQQAGGEEKEAALADIRQGNFLRLFGRDSGAGFKVMEICILSGVIGLPDKPEEEELDQLTGLLIADGETVVSEQEIYASATRDQSVVVVKNGGQLTLSGGTLTKTGSASKSGAHGLNAVVSVNQGSAGLTDSVLLSAAKGANGVFAAGEGTKVNLENIEIHTQGDFSNGLEAVFSGIIEAMNVDVTTEGAFSAPLTASWQSLITLNGGSLSSAGESSPCVYSTGEVVANKVTGQASDSPAAIVEGDNSVALKECDLTGGGDSGVMLYQVTSAEDTEVVTRFSALNSRLATTGGGPMFYVTNTAAQVLLADTELEFDSGILVKAAGNETNNWGIPGSNGGSLTLTAKDQRLSGDILCDAQSEVSLLLTEGSVYKGAVNSDAQAAGLSLTLDESSGWTLSGDSYVTALTNARSDCANIQSAGYHLYYAADNPANAWLGGRSLELAGGGSLLPW